MRQVFCGWGVATETKVGSPADRTYDMVTAPVATTR